MRVSKGNSRRWVSRSIKVRSIHDSAGGGATTGGTYHLSPGRAKIEPDHADLEILPKAGRPSATSNHFRSRCEGMAKLGRARPKPKYVSLKTTMSDRKK